MAFPVSQKRIATLCFLDASSSMRVPCPSACGGGAGGGLLVEVLSATWFAVGLEDWRARPCASVEGNGGTSAVPFRTAFAFASAVEAVVVVALLRGRVGVRLESLESGEGPCALVRAQERMRSGIYE